MCTYLWSTRQDDIMNVFDFSKHILNKTETEIQNYDLIVVHSKVNCSTVIK